jgi:hypothetical protein
MKINLDRLCRLAGVEAAGTGVLSEASNRSMHDDTSLAGEAEFRYGNNQLSEADMPEGDMPEGDMPEGDMDEEDLDEMIEIDEVMLVQEIRRAKKMMAEARERKQDLQETQLRKMISKEVDAVFKDLNLTSGWVYGKKKPTNRHKGAVNTAFPGIGFKNK